MRCECTGIVRYDVTCVDIRPLIACADVHSLRPHVVRPRPGWPDRGTVGRFAPIAA